MKSCRVILMVVCLFLSNSSASAGDVSSLEDAFEHVIARLNAHDQEGFMKVWHPEAVLIVYDYLFPLDRSDAGDEVWKQIFKDFFSSAKVTMTAVDVDFRVVGNTGLVWGMIQTMLKPGNGNSQVQSLRISATFVETGGAWKLVNWHSSTPPD